jgi:hypothetical protein
MTTAASGQMDTETHGRFQNALAAAANRAHQYGAGAMLVPGHETSRGGCGAVPVGTRVRIPLGSLIFPNS